MSGKLEIILCCNASPKRLPITMRQSALTVKLLICQSGYQRRWGGGGLLAEVGGGKGGGGGGGRRTQGVRLINKKSVMAGVGGEGCRRRLVRHHTSVVI